MKLKVPYKFDTWGEDKRYDSKSAALNVNMSGFEIGFRFNDKHKLIGVDIYVPNVDVNRNKSGEIDPRLTNDQEIQVHSLVNYISNVLWKQTGSSSYSKKTNPEYVPESETDEEELKGDIALRTMRVTMDAIIQGPPDISETALTYYLGVTDALAMYVDANSMTNQTGKFREFFRILDHYFPYKFKKFDQEASKYLSQFNPKWTETYLGDLRDLRNRCSHAKRKRDYITSNSLEGIKEINANLNDLKEMAETLLEHPPS